MLYILRQFIHPSFLICHDNMSYYIQERNVIEEYFERGKKLTGLQYAKGGIFLKGNKKIDCSGLPIVFGDKLGLRNKNKKRQYTNSYKLFLLGNKRKNYFDIRRGDTIFFLPIETGSYHIAFAVGPVKNNTLRIFDFFSEKKQGRMSERDLKLSKCGRSYCYMGWRILVRTNIFEEQKKLLHLKKNK